MKRGATRRLSAAALGVALVVLVGAALGTGALYVGARLGLPSPIRLAVLDAVHAYTGLAGAAVLVVKVARVGLRRRVPGMVDVDPRHRLVSWAILLLFAAVFATGIAAVLPAPPALRRAFVNAHLLTSVWAFFPTTWHVLQYRRRALPFLRRGGRRWSPRRRLAGVLAIVAAGCLATAAFPRALAPVTATGAGGTWHGAGLGGVALNVVAPAGDGRLLAGGDGLFVSGPGGRWSSVALPSGSAETDRLVEAGIRPGAAAAAASPAGHDGHGEHLSTAANGAVTAVAATGHGTRFYVATTDALFESPWPEGPYTRLPFPGTGLRAVTAQEWNPSVAWVLAADGPWTTVDGGHSWTRYTAGLGRALETAAIAYLGDVLYVSDGTGVYVWSDARELWSLAVPVAGVTDLRLDADGRLAASAPGGVALVSRDGTWTAPPGASAHAHAAGHQHAGTLATAGGRYFVAAGADPVASADGGATFVPLGGLGRPVASMTVLRGELVAATPDGLYGYPLTAGGAASPVWWAGLAGAALLAAAAAVLLSAPRRRSLVVHKRTGPGETARPRVGSVGSALRPRGT